MKVDRKKLIEELESVSAGLTKREETAQSTCFIFRDGKVQTFNGTALYSRKTILGTGIEQAVPGKLLLSTLSRFRSEEVQVEDKDGYLTVREKGRKAGVRWEEKIISQLNAVEKPETKWKPLPEDFSEAIDVVCQCCRKDDSGVLTNVHLRQDGIEATDNFQLIRWRMKLPIEPVLILGSSFEMVAAFGPREVSESDNWLHFRNKDDVFASYRKSEGRFPHIDHLLKVEGEKVELPEEIKDVAKSAEVFASENERSMITVEVKKGERGSGSIRITGESESGWYKESLNVKYEGPPLQFRIPSKLLANLTTMSNSCEVSEKVLRVETEQFTYVTVLDVREEGS